MGTTLSKDVQVLAELRSVLDPSGNEYTPLTMATS